MSVDQPKCPVCKREDTPQCVYVPAGHGSFCEFVCVPCRIVFPWGSNKFGDISRVEQVDRVYTFSLPRTYGSNGVDPKSLKHYQPDIECRLCSRDITTEPRRGGKDGWQCTPACRPPQG